MALGTGTGQGATDSVLDAETVLAGLARVAADTTEVTTTDETGDTMRHIEKFTAGAAGHIKEAGVFNNAALDGGDMLAVGDLVPSADLAISDELTITFETQLKSA